MTIVSNNGIVAICFSENKSDLQTNIVKEENEIA